MPFKTFTEGRPLHSCFCVNQLRCVRINDIKTHAVTVIPGASDIDLQPCLHVPECTHHHILSRCLTIASTLSKHFKVLKEPKGKLHMLYAQFF